MTSVNKRILEYIRSNDISLSDVAKKIGVAQSSLSRTLSSDDLKISQLVEITKALELPVTYFFDGKEHISNEEIEGYKKRIEELEYIVSLGKKHEDEKLYLILIGILDSEFKGITKETRKELLKGWREHLSLMKELRESLQINISEIDREDIIEGIKGKIIAIEQKKP